MFATWNGRNPLTIYFRGTGSDFKNFINNLVEDFNRPKFGYSGEDWDEDDYQPSDEEYE